MARTDEQTQPPSAPRHEQGFDELSALDNEIASLRALLTETPGDESHMRAISKALLRRFFLVGHLQDLGNAVVFMDHLPPPRPDEFTTIDFDPAVDEHTWVQWQPWLESQGYVLPPRYRSGWIPSRVAPSVNEDQMTIRAAKRRSRMQSKKFIHATRIADDAPVFFKVCPCEGPDQELLIAAYFSSEGVRDDSRNHCYPLLDLLLAPTREGKRYFILVFPMLRRVFEPDPETVRELLTCITELAEGLEFMHEHATAHRDIHYRNIMMDASHLIPSGWDPHLKNRVYPPNSVSRLSEPIKILSRSRVPVKYYWIDFGLSTQFESVEERGYVTGTLGLNRTLPEQSDTVPYDPFHADIRMFGDMLKDWQTGFLGLGFLDPLIAELRHDEPSLRLTAQEMHARLRLLATTTSVFVLEAPLRRRFRLEGKSYRTAWMIKYPVRILSRIFNH